MIDLKTLDRWEKDAADHKMLGYAEVFRLAMRYLAHREMEVMAIAAAIERGECEDIGDDCVREQIDAAADRMIQEMMK